MVTRWLVSEAEGWSRHRLQSTNYIIRTVSLVPRLPPPPPPNWDWDWDRGYRTVAVAVALSLTWVAEGFGKSSSLSGVIQ